MLAATLVGTGHHSWLPANRSASPRSPREVAVPYENYSVASVSSKRDVQIASLLLLAMSLVRGQLPWHRSLAASHDSIWTTGSI